MSSSALITDNDHSLCNDRYSITGILGADQLIKATNHTNETADENINQELLCLIIEFIHYFMINKTFNNDEICSPSSRTASWEKHKSLKISTLLARRNQLHHHRQGLSTSISSLPLSSSSLSPTKSLSSRPTHNSSSSIVHSQNLLGAFSSCLPASSNSQCPMFFDDQYCFFNCSTKNTGKRYCKIGQQCQKLITEANINDNLISVNI